MLEFCDVKTLYKFMSVRYSTLNRFNLGYHLDSREFLKKQSSGRERNDASLQASIWIT
jgi:hypothetical protein